MLIAAIPCKRVRMEHIRPPHVSMRIHLCFMLTFASANIMLQTVDSGALCQDRMRKKSCLNCKYSLAHPTLCIDRSALCCYTPYSLSASLFVNVAFNQSCHLIVHCFFARFAEMNAHHVGGLSDFLNQHRCVLLNGLCYCVRVFCHSIPPEIKKAQQGKS